MSAPNEATMSSNTTKATQSSPQPFTPQAISSSATTTPAPNLLIIFLLYYISTQNTTSTLIVYWILRKIHQICIWICIFLMISYKFGYVKRFIMFMTEKELSKAMNGTVVTVSNIEVNFFMQRVEIVDLVIHTPQRNEWRWDSPLIARIGRVSAHVNILSLIDHPFFVKSFSVKDIYSVVIEDIQVFVEKRRNIFNFHLLDNSLEIPDPKEVLESMESLKSQANKNDDDEDEENTTPETSVPSTTALVPTADESKASEDFNPVPAGHQHKANRSKSSIRAETRANEIVTQVLGAVSSLGRAANEGGKEGLHLALQKQKDGFVHQLKKLQAENSNKNDNMTYDQATNFNARDINKCLTKKKKSDGSSKSSSSIEHIAKEGMRVMKHVGKVVEQNVSNIKKQVDSFSKPPPKKEGWVGSKNNDLFRVGGIVLKDARVFTKDMMMVVGPSSSAATIKTAGGDSAPNTSDSNAGNMDSVTSDGLSSGDGEDIDAGGGSGANNSASTSKRPPNASGWSKPILIKELVISAAELCPPMSLRHKSLKKLTRKNNTNSDSGAYAGTEFENDANEDDFGDVESDEIPAVGQDIDKIVDVIVKRLMVEMGKTNTGRLLHTAFGEVFAWMEVHNPSNTSILLS